MNTARLLQLCANRQNPYLALKVIKRYKLDFREANKHYVSGFREAMRKEEEEWQAICDALVK